MNVSRRSLTKIAAAVAVAGAMPLAFAQREREAGRAAGLSRSTATAANLLLVHGAWQGAWVWDEVVAMLAGRGLVARALDLPGSGDDQTPASEVTLHAYAQAILRAARAMPDGPLVLVGHSMGGAAITAAASAEPELFTRLVYVCAFLPRPGESVAALAKEGYMQGVSGPRTEMIDSARAVRLLPEFIEQTFLNDCSRDVVAKALPRFKPQPVAPLGAAATWSKGFQALPKTYVHCAIDRAIAPGLQLLMADRAGVLDVRTLESGHEPFLSRPRELTELLQQAAAGTS